MILFHTWTTLQNKRTTTTVGKNLSLSIECAGDISVAKKSMLSSDPHVLVKNKKAAIELMSNGDVVIRGPNLLVEAVAQLRLKGSDGIAQEG